MRAAGAGRGGSSLGIALPAATRQPLPFPQRVSAPVISVERSGCQALGLAGVGVLLFKMFATVRSK